MNNNLLNKIAKRHSSNIRKYERTNNSLIYEDDTGKKFVAKKNTNNILNIYNYLNSRGFGYLPRLVYCDNDGYVYEYEENYDMPKEQKISDLIKVISYLHNKTVYYKEVTIDEIKEMYESLTNKIEDTYNYYNDLMTVIESNVFMSPSYYMLARNCSSIFSCLEFCKNMLNDWYEIMKDKNKKRVVLLHNNLDVDHLIKSNENILISWDNVQRQIPIYDFIYLYKNNYDKYDFIELYKEYNSKFPLLEEEKKLLYVMLFIPDKIDFSKSEMTSTINVSKLCNYLYTTDRLFMENEAEYAKE